MAELAVPPCAPILMGNVTTKMKSTTDTVHARNVKALESYFRRTSKATAQSIKEKGWQWRGGPQRSMSGTSLVLPRLCTSTLPSPAGSAALSGSTSQGSLEPHRLCNFAASPLDGINTLLSVLKLGPSDTFFDLGCGDGRVVMAVAEKFKCKAVGVDLNPALIKQARSRADAKLQSKPDILGKISFVEDDIRNAALENATAIYIYMPCEALQTLFSTVLPSTRIEDGTLLFTEEHWVRDRSALRHCKWKTSYWKGGLHVYEWRRAPCHKVKSTV